MPGCRQATRAPVRRGGTETACAPIGKPQALCLGGLGRSRRRNPETPRQTAAAADEALRSLPARLSLRARVAEHAYAAAAQIEGCGTSALSARWEGYCAAPSTRTLLDLWDAAGHDRCRWMARAAAEPLVRPPEAEGRTVRRPVRQSPGGGWPRRIGRLSRMTASTSSVGRPPCGTRKPRRN
jgi:hypothetical protein